VVAGAVAAEASIEEAVAAPAVSAARAAARPEDRWVAVPPWVRPEGLQYGGRGEVAPLWVRPAVREFADQWAAALPWVRAGVRQYADQWVAAPR
jgi:hypothetical protein